MARSTGGSHPLNSTLRGEILEQPQAVARLFDLEFARLFALGKRLRGRKPRFVMIAARGTSDNAARYAQYAFGMQCRLPVALAAPSLTTLYGTPPLTRGALVVGISQSGRSPDVVETVATARRGGAFTLAIVNDTESPLAAAAHEVIPLHAGIERSVAATKTYTTQLAAVAMLAAALGATRGATTELAHAPLAMRQALESEPLAREAARTLAAVQRAVTISRGIHYSTSCEIALKLKELALLLVEPYSSADFEHGPIALMEGAPQRTPPAAIVISPPHIAAERELLQFIERLRRKGARVIAIGPSSGIPVPSAPEWLSPLAAVIPGQWLAFHGAVARGLDPDRPHGIRKVTRTM
jgi:glucosamine--fructose-6-phosphate aminotransferase (isomerizing)